MLSALPSECLGAYVISMTSNVSDILAVMLLQKEAPAVCDPPVRYDTAVVEHQYWRGLTADAADLKDAIIK